MCIYVCACVYVNLRRRPWDFARKRQPLGDGGGGETPRKSIKGINKVLLCAIALQSGAMVH